MKSKEQRKFWDKARDEELFIVKKIEKSIPEYDYADKGLAMETDNSLASFLLGEFSKARDMFRHIRDLLYELQKEKPIDKDFQEILDSFDIFIDEIEVRYCEWPDEIPKEGFKTLIKHDWGLVELSMAFNKELEDFYHNLMTVLKNSRSFIERDEAFWNAMRKKLRNFEKKLADLVILFREREVICNIRPEAFEKTFKALSKEIRDKFEV